jgi:hypothetical protein
MDFSVLELLLGSVQVEKSLFSDGTTYIDSRSKDDAVYDTDITEVSDN